MNPKVSVLVPIYNVSAYIERCSHSLFSQTFTELEYLFVNDASTDNSLKILLSVLEQYPQNKAKTLILQHDMNRGLAAARNTLLDNAKGDYVMIVDSDDYIELDMIETLYNEAISKNADIVISDFYMEFGNRTVYTRDFLAEDASTRLKEIILNDNSHSFLWNKLIKKDLYSRPNCRVPEGLNYWEDRHVMTRLFFYADTIVKVNRAFYHYVKYNELAITNIKTEMHFDNVIQFWSLLDKFLAEHCCEEEYCEIIALSKIRDKARLMIDSNSIYLRKKYTDIFMAEEKKYFRTLRLSEKIMLKLLQNKLYFCSHLFKKLLHLKQKIAK